jgi:hypothetical protein
MIYISRIDSRKPPAVVHAGTVAVPSVLSLKFAEQKMSRIGAILCRKSSPGVRRSEEQGARLRDATVKTHKATAVLGAHSGRSRVASTRKARGTCSAVRGRNLAVVCFSSDTDFDTFATHRPADLLKLDQRISDSGH